MIRVPREEFHEPCPKGGGGGGIVCYFEVVNFAPIRNSAEMTVMVSSWYLSQVAILKDLADTNVHPYEFVIHTN